MRHASRIVLIALLAVAMTAVIGCSSDEPADEVSVLEPRIEPPLIGEAGVLRAGIDLGYPPYGGTDKGTEAGIDIDVASAMAMDFGLELQVVDVSLEGAAAALEAGDVDIVFAVPFNERYATSFRFAGSYLVDGPAVFAAAGTLADEADLSPGRVAAQEGSEAFWILDHAYGEGYVQAFPTLREAFDALVAGDVDAVAGDAVVGAYLARDVDGIEFSFQLDAAAPIGVAVGEGAEEFEIEVRALLDSMQADGVIDTIRSKWVGDLPKLELPEATGM